MKSPTHNPTDLPAYAAPHYFGRDLEAMSCAGNYHDWICDDLRPWFGANVAEIGAGVGHFSRRVLADGGVTRLTAFEPSANMFPLLRAALEGESRATTINRFFGEHPAQESFDSVLYVNVLEHVEDDAAELAVARARLKPGGHVMIFVPALPWLYGALDAEVGHVRRYLKRDLVERVRQAGFSIVTARYFDIAGVLPWYLHCVLLKNSLSPGSVSLYDKCVIPVMRRIERLITPPIGKNLLLIGRKDPA